MKKELETRLIHFAVEISSLSDNLRHTSFSQHLSSQIIRSGSSCALNFGEAQSAESAKDFIHKIGLVLKELRETIINLKIIREAKLYKDPIKLDEIIRENDELLAIFYSTYKTAKKNQLH